MELVASIKPGRGKERSRVICSPRQFLVLQDWLATPFANSTTVIRAWLRELHLDPADFEYKQTEIVVDWSKK